MSTNGLMKGTNLQLTIVMDPQTGQVSLTGPINDKLFCYGLLELAKECIRTHAEQSKNQILVARPKIVGID